MERIAAARQRQMHSSKNRLSIVFEHTGNSTPPKDARIYPRLPYRSAHKPQVPCSIRRASHVAELLAERGTTL